MNEFTELLTIINTRAAISRAETVKVRVHGAMLAYIHVPKNIALTLYPTDCNYPDDLGHCYGTYNKATKTVLLG